MVYRSDYYILKNKIAIPVDIMEWSKWFETKRKDRIVKQTTLPNGLWISTVFLGMDHSFSDGPPLLFETMVFPKGSLTELSCDRCTTYDQAVKQHINAVKRHTKVLKQGRKIYGQIT